MKNSETRSGRSKNKNIREIKMKIDNKKMVMQKLKDEQCGNSMYDSVQ